MKSCKLRVRVQHLGTNKYISLVSCISNLFTSWHGLLQSQPIVHGYLLSTYSCGIRILSAMGMESGSGADTLSALFRSTITGVVVWGFRSSSVAADHMYVLLTMVIWWSHTDLSGLGPHKLIAIFINTLNSPEESLSLPAWISPRILLVQC